MTNEKRILCVFAHPDDESYGPGGTIAHYAMNGVSVRLLMFTRGEAGSIGISKELPNDELARRRVLELGAACRELGIASHRILGVPDKGVNEVDPDWAVGEILSDIAAFHPQIVMTFHRRGVSGHSDHIAVTQYLARAFDEAGDDGPVKMYEWGIPFEKVPLYDRPTLAALRDDEIHASIDISDAAMDRKVAAIRAHETQVVFFESLVERFDYREVSRPEVFSLRASRVGPQTGVAADLFSGIGGGRE